LEAAVAQRPNTDEWRSWPVAAKRQLLRRLRERVYGSWRERARPDQLPPREWDEDEPGAPSTLFLGGGRGSGKTWAGAHIFTQEIERDPLRDTEGPGEWAIVAPTFGDARDKCIEGESGLLAALGTTAAEVEAKISPTVAKWNRSIGELYLHDSTFIQIDGGDDGAYRIQGLNLRGVWCDEIGLWKKWKTAWRESIGFALRKGHARRIATGTPKRSLPARQLIKELLANDRVICRRLLTEDNWDNLSDTFKEEVEVYVGTELGRQELRGELLDEVEGALWQRDWIEQGRVKRSPLKGYRRKVLALDPSDGKEGSDDQAWCLAGLGVDHQLYVVDSEAMRTTPLKWLTAAVILADEENAVIVIEMNHGGEALIGLLEQAMKELGVRVPYMRVYATEHKKTRAEPVAMLYEQGYSDETPELSNPVIHHINDLPELEDEMCEWTGDPGETSPNRLDALVWAITHLKRYSRKPQMSENGRKAAPYTEKKKARGAVAWK
jgi:phage terminase large subunit-like protein